MREIETALPILPALRWRTWRFALAILTGLSLMQICRLAGLQGGVMQWLVASVLYAMAMGIAALAMRRGYPHLRIGGCNVTTALRAAMTFALIAPLLARQPMGSAVALLALIAMTLDGLDGWLARRSGLVSEFGARFDIESDAILALVLALHLWLGRGMGWAALSLGAPYYLFVAAGRLCPWLTAPLPPARRRKLICVAQLGVLVILQFALVPPAIAHATAGVAALLLLGSFAIDILWLWRRR